MFRILFRWFWHGGGRADGGGVCVTFGGAPSVTATFGGDPSVTATFGGGDC